MRSAGTSRALLYSNRIPYLWMHVATYVALPCTKWIHAFSSVPLPIMEPKTPCKLSRLFAEYVRAFSSANMVAVAYGLVRSK